MERGCTVLPTARWSPRTLRDASLIIDAVVARYPLLLADPAAGRRAARAAVADQLVLVTPASPDAAGALAMTLEWLDAHGHAGLPRTRSRC